MRNLRAWFHRFGGLFRREQRDQEFSEELESNLQVHIADNLRRGMALEEARRQANLKLGGVEQTKEMYREQRGLPWLETFLQDLRYGARMLQKHPGLTLVVILTLSVAIGTSTAVFSVVHAVLLQPLPFPEPDRLVRVWAVNATETGDREGPSAADLLDWRAESTAFDAMAGWHHVALTWRGESDAEELRAGRVTEDFFRVFGVQPLHGRSFTPEEVVGTAYATSGRQEGGERTVVLSEKWWRRRFGGDPSIVGNAIVLNDEPWRVVGVMPERFALPGEQADIWIPWDPRVSYAQRYPDGPPRDFRFLRAAARLKPGVSREQAESQLDALCAAMEVQFPSTNRGWGARLVGLQDDLVAGARPAILVAMGAVGVLLLTACANVAGLLLAVAARRRSEMAVRLALGAAPVRLVRQLLTESCLLTLTSGALGVALAFWGLNALLALAPAGIPRLNEVQLAPTVLCFALGISILSGLLCGMAPALHAAKTNLAASMQGERRGATGSLRQTHARGALVVAQVAAAIVLLVSAGLLVRSFWRLRGADLGFQPEGLLVARVSLNSGAYRSADHVNTYYRALRQRFTALPGVISVGLVTALPMSDVGTDFERPYWRPGEEASHADGPKVAIRMVSPGYFQTMRMQLIRGRDIQESDNRDAPRRLVVNQTLARRAWPGKNAVGQQIIIDYLGGAYPYEVVGVVSDTRHNGPRQIPQSEVFIPHAQVPYALVNVVLRVAGDLPALADIIRTESLALDPAQPLHSVVTMEQLFGRRIAADRFVSTLLGFLAGVVMLLAVIGLYGLLAYSVTRRRHEIGIRMALGATPKAIVRMILRQGMTLALAGGLAGLLGAWAVPRLFAQLLFKTGPHDPAVLSLVLGGFLVTALLACTVPAYRATRVDPSTALRCE